MKARDRKQRLTAATARYLRQIGRKAQKREEPNDRGFDHKLHEKLKRMRPEEVDALFRGDEGTIRTTANRPPQRRAFAGLTGFDP